jgi:SprT protein
MIITESFAETESGILVPTTAELQRLCEDRIAELRDYTEKHFQHTMPKTRLRYNLKGNRAGTANSSKSLININYVLLKENTEHYIKQTLGHEYAHLITDSLYLYNLISKPTAHGREWKRVMRKLCLRPNRCHNYDTVNAGGKKQRQWKYYCKCPKSMTISTTIHNRIKKGRKYRCNKCKTTITRG